MKLNDQLGYNLYRSALLFRRELMRALRDCALTPEQWQTLAALWESGPLTPSEISQLTLQDLPAVSRMLARMERSRWIRRAPTRGDKRSFRVALTSDGRKLQSFLPQRLLAHFDRLLAEFPGRRREALLTLLRELRAVLGDLPRATPERRRSAAHRPARGARTSARHRTS